MQYLMLIHQGDTVTPNDREAWGALSEAEQDEIRQGYQALNEIPGVTPGPWMQPPDTATTVRVAGGETLVTDGPFVETKEALGGFFTLEADDLDAAIEVAAKLPPARLGGAIEIRGIVEY